MSRRGLHVMPGGVALAQMGFLRNMCRMATVRQVPGRSGWYMDYRDAAGRRRILRGGDTRAEAEVNLSLRASKIAVVRAGLVSRQAYELGEHATRPIDEHLTPYLASLRGKRRTSKHVAGTERMIRAWLAGTGAASLECVDPVRTAAWLADLIDARGLSHRTHNSYLKAAKGFLNWCVRHGRLPANPLASIDPLNVAEDRRRPSRALSPAELAALLGVAPMPRRLYYTLAARMGLRWGEVRTLRWEHFDLDSAAGPLLILDAARTKNRRADALPVPSDVAAILRPLRAASGSGPLFHATPTMRTWKADLVRAGLASVRPRTKANGVRRWSRAELAGYVGDRGQIDRKSLRLTFGTDLARAGVPLQHAQRLLRHSDPRLTATIYTDPWLLDLHAAVERAVPGPPAALNAMKDVG